MADLDKVLHNITDNCAPKRDNACLQDALKGLTLLDMTRVSNDYLTFALQNAEKHLPVFDFDGLAHQLDNGTNPKGPGTPSAYRFHEPY